MSSATDTFLLTLRQHHLLEPAQLDALADAAQLEPKALAAELIRRGWLTSYQADQVLQGRAGNLVLGSYVILEQLAEGGMGAIYKVRNWKLGRVAALKLIRKDRLTDDDAVRRFRREIRAAAQLTHANIVHAYDADEVDGTHFFVMEFIAGRDLARVLDQQGALPIAAACDYIRQAALGLQHAHERGLVHRDIKPANLLLTESGVVKILDLGLAHLRGAAADENSGTLTERGMVMGTMDYIAPEQAADSHQVDIRADIYSLGCTFYHLLAGRPPFLANAAVEKLFKHRYEEPAPLEKLRADVPPAVRAVVARLMAKLPADRYQTPADLAAVLASGVPTVVPAYPGLSAAASGSGGATEIYRDNSVAPPRPRRRTRLWLVAGIALPLLLMGMAGIAFVLLAGSGQREGKAAPRTVPRNTASARQASAPKTSRSGPPKVTHDAVDARVTLVPEPSILPSRGARRLTEGLLADGDEASSKGWVSWHQSTGPVEVTLDLDKPTKVTKLGAHFLRAIHVTLPVKVEFAVSEDGKEFRTVATLQEKDGTAQRGWFTAALEGVTARRVRIRATPGIQQLSLDAVAVNPQPEEPNFRHAALGRPVTMAHPPGGNYDAPGILGLTDGFIGRSPDFLNLVWLGVEGRNFEATIDLGRDIDLREAGGHFLQCLRVGVRIPPSLDVLVSSDGKEFHAVGTVKHTPDERPAYMKTLSVKLHGVTARFVKVVGLYNGLWIFADEVFVNPEPGAGRQVLE